MEIYKIYCLKNEEGKIMYIGQTRRTLCERLKEHHKKFKHRKKYTIHLLEETPDLSKADELETYYIKKYNTVENGENITYGKGTKGLGANKTSFKKGNTYGGVGKKKVKCIETGIVYESIGECSKKLNLSRNKISDVCNKKRKSTGNLHFEFA